MKGNIFMYPTKIFNSLPYAVCKSTSKRFRSFAVLSVSLVHVVNLVRGAHI